MRSTRLQGYNGNVNSGITMMQTPTRSTSSLNSARGMLLPQRCLRDRTRRQEFFSGETQRLNSRQLRIPPLRLQAVLRQAIRRNRDDWPPFTSWLTSWRQWSRTAGFRLSITFVRIWSILLSTHGHLCISARHSLVFKYDMHCISLYRFKVKWERVMSTDKYSTGIVQKRARDGIEQNLYVHSMTRAAEISFVPYSLNASTTPSQIAASLIYREN